MEIDLNTAQDLRALAHQALAERQFGAAKYFFGECLTVCKTGFLASCDLSWMQIFVPTFHEYGRFLNQIDPKAALKMWRASSRKLDDTDPHKVYILREQMETLCILKEWKQTKQIAQMASQKIQELIQLNPHEQSFKEIETEISHFTRMAESNDVTVSKDEIDMSYLPPEALQWAKQSQKGAQNKSGGHKKQKKKVNMKILPRRGYEEVQEAPKTAKLLTSNHEAALNSSTPPGTAGPSTSTTTGTQMGATVPSSKSKKKKKQKKKDEAPKVESVNTQVTKPEFKLHNQDAKPSKATARFTFPLTKSHDFTLGCPLCSQERGNKWELLQSHPGCLESRLYVRRKTDSQSLWIRIRKRQSKECSKTYKNCWNFPKHLCTSKNRDTCWFAHSNEEKDIWNAEKFQGFNIEAFINQNKGRRGATGTVRQINQRKPVLPNIPECLATFRTTYPGDFRLARNSLFYTNEGIDIWIHKRTYGTRKTELCQDKYCPKDQCPLSHTEEERDFWLLAAETNLTYEALCKRLSKRLINKPVPEVRMPALINNPFEEYYCCLCRKQCNGQNQFEIHCNSKFHMDKLNVEDGDHWQHRQPPPGLQLTLCEKHEKGTCQYSNAPGQFNYCIKAHCPEELEEWEQRMEIRQQKMRYARQKGLLSYIVKLQKQLEENPASLKLMKNQLKHVTIETNQKLAEGLKSKNDAFEWEFQVSAKVMTLQNVALLLDKDRFWFHLKHHARKNVQHLDEEDLKSHMVASSQPGNSYQITVKFNGGVYGSFRQWLVLDFGKSRLLVRHLVVDVGEQIHKEMESLRRSLQTDNWDVTIVPFKGQHITGSMESDFMLGLQDKYQLRPGDVSSSVISDILKKDNYITKMHDLLYMEETYQLQMISKFTSDMKIKIFQRATMPNGTMIPAPVGFKLVKLMLNRIFSSEGNAGYLIQRSCYKVLLRLKDDKKKAYEAPFVTKSTMFEVNGMGPDYIFVCIGDDFLKAAKITEDEAEIEVGVQFIMNRSPFCARHFAIDEVSTNLDILFPKPLENFEHKEYELKTDKLNTQQLKALNQILHHQKGDPMLILNGAFGTGKTMTLSSMALQLVKSDVIEKKSKILICTLSNSAADLFVSLLDELNQCENEKLAILRVYQENRRFYTIPEDARKYALSETGHSGYPCVKMPSVDDIKKSNVVITTVETCLALIRLKVKGIFSHIFIDEAGQTLEPQLLMPLSLATKETCIVLAGDVMQMSPKVYSPHAQVLSISLLERIFERYQIEQAIKGTQQESPHTVYLNENYRNDQLILRFLSMIIYGDQDLLEWKSGIQTTAPSLRLHVVQGEEKPGSGAGFYNEAEVQEIEHLLLGFKQNWPVEWGPRDLAQIAVTTVYSDQVEHIRHYLRRVGLSAVTVMPMESLQGRQYTVVVISTVHTAKVAQDSSENLGFFSDMKLVNTAISRAKYCAIVVGDAEALCTRGSNMFLWYTYLKLALDRNGLAVENPLRFMQNIEEHMAAKWMQQTLPSIEETSISGSIKDRADTNSENGVEIGQSWNECDQVESLSDNADYMSCEGDDLSVINERITNEQLAELNYDADVILSAFREEEGDKLLLPMLENTSEKFLPGNNLERITGVKILKLISYDQCQGLAKLELPSKDKSSKKKKRRWTPMDTGIQTESEHGEDHENTAYEDDATDDTDETFENDEYDIDEIAEMEDLLSADPQKKRCHLNVHSFKRISAVILDDAEMKGKTVTIKNRRYCKRALDGDEVVLKLRSNWNGDIYQPLQGQVLGITRRNMKMRYRTFVCRVDQTNSSLMLPLSNKLPPIVSLRSGQGTKQGYVSLHKMDKNKRSLTARNIKVEDPNARLYIVMYLKWTRNSSLPLGMVIDILPPGEDLETGRKILSHIHNVPRRISDSSELGRKCELRFPQNYMDGMDYLDRLDLRGKRIFTLDDASSQDLDDALHIEKNSNGTYSVGVHIADVTHFVKVNSDIDKEAYRRGTSYYPANERPIHMLPEYLGTDLCSLLPEKDRLAVSVIFTLSAKGEVTSSERHLTVIRSRCRLDYKEVEEVLDNHEASNNEWKDELQKLYAFAERYAKQRKGAKGFLAIEDKKDAPKARMLIEEWMVKTNKHVAEHLLTKFPDKVPLRKQMAPTEEELAEWKDKYGSQVPYSFCLERIAYLLQQPQNVQAQDGFVHILRNTWDELLENHNEYKKLNKIARSVESFPEQFCAMKSWYSIQTRAIYHCSGLGTDHLHFSLASRAYTHFTSPIRRYIDIVVHRLLKADIKNEATEYSMADVSKICIHCTGTQMQAKDYEGETNLLSAACELKECPNEIHVLVKSIDHKQFEIIFPALKNMPHNLRKVPFSQLHLKQDPQVENNRATMTFQRRIYHCSETRSHPGNGAYLNSKQDTVAIPSYYWQQFLEAMANGNERKALENFTTITENVSSNNYLGFASEISSESAVNHNESQNITFRRDIESGDVLRVQLATKADKGIIKPCAQLLKLTPSLHICLEHARDPVNCFSTQQIPRQQNESVQEYKRYWLALLSMESAYSVIKSPGDQAHVHNVPAEWKKCNDGVVHGRMKMARPFCERRFLLFTMDVLLGKESKDDGGKNWVERTHQQVQGVHCNNWKITLYGFMCIKFNFKTKDGKSMTWVGHFHITDVLIDTTDVILILKLNQSSYDFPDEALNMSVDATPRCSVHWLDKPTPDVRTESAVLDLSDCHPESLPVLLSLRDIVPSTDYSEEINIRLNTPVLKAPNEEQAKALKTALQSTNKFVVIWGPPGTGKSITGVKLASLFAKNNEPHEQVLYCGPSNKSVNVVTAKLKQLNLKVVRIFGEKLVNRYYPLPNFPQKAYIDDETVDAHQDVALHELVRQTDRPFAEMIREFDALFKDPKTVTLKDIKEYKQIIGKAYIAELARAQVILCTCSSSGNALFKDTFTKNVKQVIVDECGMCKEPETLIPLVACNPQKVVLIGDHKQLRPVINCPQAKKNGLDHTLFEEYAEHSIMLQLQYRMHKMIQEFPSQKFYKGKLRHGLPEQTKPIRPYKFWPAGPNMPIVFCHVEGEEDMQSVTTDTAGKNSCCNMAEVHQVVKVVEALVQGHIDPEKIAVLTPYRFQLMKIREKLNDRGWYKVTVTTITNSQGSEYPYVILSTVRSLPEREIEENPWNSWCLDKLGFLTDPHQVNVALTRAKNGLIIIGNAYLLRCNEIWKDLLDFYQNHSAVTDRKSFP